MREWGRDKMRGLREWRVGEGVLEMGVRVRALGVEEIPAIGALIAASVWGLQVGDYMEAQWEAAVRTVFSVDSRLVGDSGYLGAFVDGASLVGCGGWSGREALYGGNQQVEEQAPECLDPALDAAKIRAIFVHPGWARRGIGGMLLRRAQAVAMAAGFRRLEMGSTLTGLDLSAGGLPGGGTGARSGGRGRVDRGGAPGEGGGR